MLYQTYLFRWDNPSHRDGNFRTEERIMKWTIKTLALCAVLAAGMGLARADDKFVVSAGEAANHYYLSLGDYFQITPERVAVARDKNVTNEELPVVFFIAQQSHMTVEQVIDYRGKDRAWRKVAKHFGLGPEVFYVELKQPEGPYGRPYAEFAKRSRDKWGKVNLEDADIVNLVNLRFLSEHYRVTSDQVVKWRAEGQRFVDIDTNLDVPGFRAVNN